MATEIICFEIARQMHLPTAPLAVVLLDTRLLARCGILVKQADCAAKGPQNGALRCLGVRSVATVKVGLNGRLTRPLSARARSLLIGQAVLETGNLLSSGNGFIFWDFARAQCRV